MSVCCRIRFSGPKGRTVFSACGVRRFSWPVATTTRIRPARRPPRRRNATAQSRRPTPATDATDAEKQAAAVIAEIDGTKPPPKSRQTQRISRSLGGPEKSPDDKDDIKPPRLRRQVAEYSDGTVVNDGHYTEWYPPGKGNGGGRLRRWHAARQMEPLARERQASPDRELLERQARRFVETIPRRWNAGIRGELQKQSPRRKMGQLRFNGQSRRREIGVQSGRAGRSLDLLLR